MFAFREYLLIVGTLWLVLIRPHDAGSSGYCSIPSERPDSQIAYDLRCVRHNYSDFRDSQYADLFAIGTYQGQLQCKVLECGLPFVHMEESCPGNKTRACLESYTYPPGVPECLYLPHELSEGHTIPIPSLYELRISDDLYLQSQMFVRQARGLQKDEMLATRFFYIVNTTYNYIRSGRGNETHCLEMEKSIDWCNDASKKRSFNGTYVLCREEKDLWRVMSEFGRRAPQCVRYYINKHFLQTKEFDDFKKDMTKVCSKFENEMEKIKEKDFLRTHTTERHSIAVNTFDACCFLKKTRIIEMFPCVEEATTPWPETPAPTGELRNESNILVLSIEENGLPGYRNLLASSIALLVLLF